MQKLTKTLIRSFTFGLVLAATSSIAQQTVHTTQGKVVKANVSKGVVTLAHEPIEALKWPRMTMGFKVMDKMLLDKLEVGKTVDFEFVEADGDYVITDVKLPE